MQVIGNLYRSKVACGISIQMVIPLQAYFGNTECSVLSYKKMVLLHQGHELAKQITELGGDESAADGRKWSCFTTVIPLPFWQKVVRAFFLLPCKTRVSSQVRLLPGGLFSLLCSFELYGMLSISQA